MRVRWFPGGSSSGPVQAAGGRRAITAPEVEELVESRSGGEPHEVKCRNGHWSCSCHAYTKGSKECWAIKQVRAAAQASLTRVK